MRMKAVPMRWLLASVVLLAGCGDPPPTPVATATAEQGRFVETITASGRVVSAQSVEIKAEASGQVAAVPVGSGMAVRAGDLLVQLDPEDEQRTVARAEAAVAAGRARLEQSQVRLDQEERSVVLARARAAAQLDAAVVRAADSATRAARQRDLLRQGVTTSESADGAITSEAGARSDLAAARLAIDEALLRETDIALRRTEVAQAEADLRSRELDLDDARRRLAKTRITAPVDGTVTRVLVEVGQIVSSGITTVGGGTQVAAIADLSRLSVQVDLPESDVGRVHPGQRAVVTCEAFPGRRFSGTVASIASEGTREGRSVSFPVTIRLAGSDLPLRPPMTVGVEITTVDDPAAITVPVEAVRRVEGRTEVVLRSASAAASSGTRAVVVGGTDGRRQQILSGLDAGESVELPPAGKIRWRDEMDFGL
jgi:HlyD family secretion protein